jgi:hypothetical protein
VSLEPSFGRIAVVSPLDRPSCTNCPVESAFGRKYRWHLVQVTRFLGGTTNPEDGEAETEARRAQEISPARGCRREKRPKRRRAKVIRNTAEEKLARAGQGWTGIVRRRPHGMQLYSLIAVGDIFVDLQAALLSEPDNVRVRLENSRRRDGERGT